MGSGLSLDKQHSKGDVMKNSIALFLVIILSGCGLSPEYRYNQLRAASDYEVCHELTEPRDGIGFQISKEAASRLAKERALSCDRDRFARIHALESMSRGSDSSSGECLIEMGRVLSMPMTAGQQSERFALANSAQRNCERGLPPPAALTAPPPTSAPGHMTCKPSAFGDRLDCRPGY